jgi:hypothetical protein
MQSTDLQQVAGNVLRRTHLIHVGLTLVLFFSNVLLTQMISTDRFIGRLKYVGHEMAFLACGIELSRLFTVNTGDNREVILAMLFVYVLLWILTVFLTKKVLSNAPIMLTPLIGATLAIGLGSVACALSGVIDSWAIKSLAG